MVLRAQCWAARRCDFARLGWLEAWRRPSRPFPDATLRASSSELQLELARQGRCGRLGHAARHNLAAGVGVGREHAVIPEHVKVRRRDQGDEPRDEIKRVQQHGVRAISPGVFEPVARRTGIVARVDDDLDRRSPDLRVR